MTRCGTHSTKRLSAREGLTIRIYPHRTSHTIIQSTDISNHAATLCDEACNASHREVIHATRVYRANLPAWTDKLVTILSAFHLDGEKYHVANLCNGGARLPCSSALHGDTDTVGCRQLTGNGLLDFLSFCIGQVAFSPRQSTQQRRRLVSYGGSETQNTMQCRKPSSAGKRDETRLSCGERILSGMGSGPGNPILLKM